jgi:hypothetical protein
MIAARRWDYHERDAGAGINRGVADVNNSRPLPGIFVIGGGIAGQTACEAIRERDRTVPLTMLCAEPFSV